MNTPEHIESAIKKAYRLSALLDIAALAVESEQTLGPAFEKRGGRLVMEMAAEMAGEIVDGLECGAA